MRVMYLCGKAVDERDSMVGDTFKKLVGRMLEWTKGMKGKVFELGPAEIPWDCQGAWREESQPCHVHVN